MMKGSSTMPLAIGCGNNNSDEGNEDRGNDDKGHVDYRCLLDDMVQPRCGCYDVRSSTRRL
jgi:hypothetical protein